GAAEIILGLVAGVGGFALAGAGAGHVRHVHRHFHFQDVYAVAVAGKLFHGADDEIWLLAGELDAFLINAFRIGDEFEKVGNVAAPALVADALDPGVLLVVDVRGIRGSVVEKNLDAIGAGFHEAARGIVGQQIGKAAGLGVVVAALLVGQEQAGVLGAGAGGLEAVLRVEQDGAGVRGENADHRFLEFAHHVGVHFFFVHAFFFGDEVAQRAALVHGRRGDHALGVGHRFHSFDLARADLHGIASHSQG